MGATGRKRPFFISPTITVSGRTEGWRQADGLEVGTALLLRQDNINLTPTYLKINCGLKSCHFAAKREILLG
jgi:hypothetical protein